MKVFAVGGALGALAIGLGAPAFLHGYYELAITLALCAVLFVWRARGARWWLTTGAAAVCAGTIGIAIVLAIHGFHHGLGYLFTSQGVENAKTNPLGLDFHGSYFGALVIAVLAPVYIFYGFESAGDISEETKDAGRQVPRAMRYALIWGSCCC